MADGSSQEAADKATAEVAGYTAAADGPRPQAIPLSRARAQTVVTYLVGRRMVANRLRSRGHGDQHPVATGAGRQLNRRVVITLHTD
ncbi:MAG: hypothetical protein DLM59_07930 [Pseudonocardiales bacterium]|nr:MAG: hypothetical protein DLM59_07930 [Pseudonocardiales bacterium]